MATGTRKAMDMEDHLKLLSRELDTSLSQQAPEEHIKRALQAHGFFTRQKHVEDNPVPVEHVPGSSTKENEKTQGITEEDRRRTTQLISHFREGKEVHTLREPWGLNHHCGGPLQPAGPRWPVELECLPLRLKFIANPPPCAEPFCLPECTDATPRVLSAEGEGEVVYHNSPVHAKCFSSARTGHSLKLTTQPHIEPDSTTLIFESRFESGNLEKVMKVGMWDYELLLRGDLYTKKHTQWYFFRVQNMRAGQTYRFTIINLYKDSSLYCKGMQPVFYSEADSKTQKVGWRRSGHSIRYFKSPVRRPNINKESYFYCLTWSHTFQHDQDTCYFAHCYPYTYCDLLDDLRAIQVDPLRASCCKQRTLCHSLAGNMVPILTITSPAQSHNDHKCKRAVVISARVHPGETNSSWMMKGLLDYLTGQSSDAKMLRELFVFKVVPMLNPDGVIAGNYRCSLAGRDLNRNYRSKLKSAYPSIWHTKAMVKKLSEEREIVLYCDLHGHSKKQNVFIYGCDNNEDKANKLCGRVFAKMLSMNAPSKFSYESSKFTVHKSKFGTGRVYMWRELGVRNSYTMEATFCGSLLGRQSGYHFNTVDLETMGYHLCDTLLDYCDPDQTKVQQVLREVEEDYRREVIARLAAMGRQVPKGVDPLDIVLEPEGSSDSGSDSSVSDGPPLQVVARKKKKRRKLKSRKERNQHKALLKMTQKLAPIAVQQGPIHQAVLPACSLGQIVPSLESISQHASSCPEEEEEGEGHTPAFIKEQRHRLFTEMHSEVPPNMATQEKYIETITQDFAKQTLPPGGVALPGMSHDGSGRTLQETSRVLQNSSSFLARLPSLPTLPPLCTLPPPLCTLPPLPLPTSPYTYSPPINILPMALLEQKRAAAGRAGSLVSLQGSGEGRRESMSSVAQLLTNASCKTAFASQYVATYLSELVSSNSSTATSNSRNLSNLSQMFRHLYPQVSRPVHSDSKKSPPPSQPPMKTDAEHMFNDPSTGQQIGQSSHHGDDPSAPPKESSLSPSPSKGRKYLVPMSSSDPSVSSSQSTAPQLSAKDKRLIADIRSSYNSSSLHNDSTTSWESFVQPAKILPKSCSSDTSTVVLGVKELHLEQNQASFTTERKELHLERNQASTTGKGVAANTNRLVVSGDRRAMVRSEASSDQQKVTGCPSGGISQDDCDIVRPPLSPSQVPSPLLTAKPNGSNVAAHKKGVAEALQGIHMREETATKERKLSSRTQSRCEQPTGSIRRNSSLSTVRAEPASMMTRIVSSHPASSLLSPRPSAYDGLRPPTVNLKLTDISPRTAHKHQKQVRYFTKRNYL